MIQERLAPVVAKSGSTIFDDSISQDPDSLHTFRMAHTTSLIVKCIHCQMLAACVRTTVMRKIRPLPQGHIGHTKHMTRDTHCTTLHLLIPLPPKHVNNIPGVCPRCSDVAQQKVLDCTPFVHTHGQAPPPRHTLRLLSLPMCLELVLGSQFHGQLVLEGGAPWRHNRHVGCSALHTVTALIGESR